MSKDAGQPKCAICLDSYTDPRFLRCFHVYCHRCLKQLVDRDRHGQLSLTCPTCRLVTPLPSRGVAGLQCLLYVSHLLAVLEEETPREGTSAGDSGGEATRLVPHGDITLCCSVHPDKQPELFCKSCGHLVCQKCSGERHKGHNCEEVTKVLARPKEGGSRGSDTVLSSVDCELVSELLGSRAKGGVERKGQGQLLIKYQPTVKGRHQLHVKVAGQHVSGSPFCVAVKSPVENLSTAVRSLGKFQRPWGVAVTPRGEMVVSEYSGHQVTVLTPRGERRSFGASGSAPGQFDHPCEVAVDGKGNIVVADSWNHRVQKFSSDGRFLKLAGSGHCPFNCPIGIAYNSFNDRLYVVDGTNVVHVLNSNLTYQCKFGEEGNKEGQFNTPWSIACDDSGKVYVADSYNNRIQVFTADGEFLWLFGRRGSGRGELGWPAGVAVDANGMVYVSEGDNYRVSVFTPKGQFVTSFGQKGEGSAGFGAVRGTAVDNSGVVYVCDRDNQLVHMF